MSTPEELRALADLLHNNFIPAALSPERQHELLLIGAVATLEALARASGAAVDEDEPQIDINPIELLRETAAGKSASNMNASGNAAGAQMENVRAQAFQSLMRLAMEGQSPAVDALYRLATEEEILAARQAILTRGWQPSHPALKALFNWFTHLENHTPYPEDELPLLTQAFFNTPLATLQRRLLITAAQNRAENWARIVGAVQNGAADALLELVERYPAFRPTERDISLELLDHQAGEGSAAAREALSLLVIRYEDPHAQQIVLERGYLPEDPEERALLLFLSDQWEAYETFDFDHSLLTSAYESSGRSMRRRLLEHSRHTGQMEWLRGLSTTGEVRWLNDLTDADWELAIRRLTENEKFIDLWRLAQVAPPIWSAAILDRLAKRSWQPEKEDERTGFISLAALAHESLSTKLTIQPKKSLHAPVLDFNCLAIHPGGKILAAGCSDARIFQWNLPDGDLREPPLIGSAPVTRALAYSPDGELLAAAYGDNRIRAFRLSTGLVLKTFEGHRAMIRALAIHPDGRTLYSAGFDGSIHFWRFPYGPDLKTLKPGSNEIFDMVLSVNGTHLISGGADTVVRVWTLPEGESARELDAHTDTVTHLAASSTSELVASAGRDGMVHMWNVASGGLVRTIASGGRPLTALCLHPNDQVMIGGHSNGDISLWNLSTGRTIDQINAHHQPITGLVLSPSGDTLYTADTGGHLQVWDLSIFLATRLPGEAIRPGMLAELENRLKNPNLSASEKKWLSFAIELARWRQRFDIELAENNPIQIGEFDIEL